MKNNCTAKKLVRYFFSSIKQSFIYEVIFIAYAMIFLHIVGVNTQISALFAITIEILIPIIALNIYCFFVLRKRLHCSVKNIISGKSISRLLVRFLAVFVFICIGYIASLPYELKSFENEFLFMIEQYVCDFNIYIITAAFPIIYAIIEYVFTGYPEQID